MATPPSGQIDIFGREVADRWPDGTLQRALCAAGHAPLRRSREAVGWDPASVILSPPSLGQWASLPSRIHARVELTLYLDPADELPAIVVSSHVNMVMPFKAHYKLLIDT
jgi:hypothetical protein